MLARHRRQRAAAGLSDSCPLAPRRLGDGPRGGPWGPGKRLWDGASVQASRAEPREQSVSTGAQHVCVGRKEATAQDRIHTPFLAKAPQG